MTPEFERKPYHPGLFYIPTILRDFLPLHTEAEVFAGVALLYGYDETVRRITRRMRAEGKANYPYTALRAQDARLRVVEAA